MPATPAWPPRSAPRLFVDTEIAARQTVRIEGNQAHYLARVMRMGPGDVAILCDDVTGEWASIATEIGKRHLLLQVHEKLREREEVPDFWLCPAILKKDRFDTLLEKACELGAAQIRPVLTHRCVADKLNADRARAIVVEAAEQCARTALPEIAPIQSLDRLLAQWPHDRLLYFADELGGQQAAEVFAANRGMPSALLTGPEGGFDDGERSAIRAAPQARPISLGPRILRGETAALAGMALWMGIAGDWNNSLAQR